MCVCTLPVLRNFVTSWPEISMLSSVFSQTECKPFCSCQAKVTSDLAYLVVHLYRVSFALITVPSLRVHGYNFCEIFVLWTMVRFIRHLLLFSSMSFSLNTIIWLWRPSQAKQRYSSCCSSSLGELQEVHTCANDLTPSPCLCSVSVSSFSQGFSLWQLLPLRFCECTISCAKTH